MSTKNMKMWVLWAGVGALLLIILMAVIQDKSYVSCSFKVNERIYPYANGSLVDGNVVYRPELTWDNIKWCEPLAFALMSFLPLILLSLITYRMKDEVFLAWFNFAKLWIPVIIAVTLLLENAGGGGGMGIEGALSGAFSMAILIILYIVFISGSLLKIIYAYIKTRMEAKEASPEQIKGLKKRFVRIAWSIAGLFVLWMILRMAGLI